MKKIHVGVALVVLLLTTVVIALGSFRVFDVNEEGATGRSSNQKPTPTQTAQASPSVPPTKSTSQTQTPQTSPSPTSEPTQSPTPMAISTYNDVSYGTDPAQRFDVYVPKNADTLLPLIIFVHGGAWIAGDKSNVSAIAIFLAQQGFVVINMNYRLLPNFSYPAPMEDIQMVLQWVNRNSEQYSIDITRIGMSGHSAGGHLIALYALTQDKDYIAGGSTLPRVYAIAPLAGGYTLQGINITSPRREDTIMEWLTTADPQSLGLPIDQIDSNDHVTFLLLHGALDVNSPPSQAVLFYNALVANGVPAELKIYPGRDHVTLVSGIPNNDEVGQDLVSFFNKNLK